MGSAQAAPSLLQRLDGIQWLRAAAAALVVVEHAKNAISTEFLGLHPDRSPLSFFPFSAGVDIFFVISGFIMAYSSAALFERQGGRRIFLLRRVARIVPIYWLVTSLMLLMFAAMGSRMWSESGWSTIAAAYLFIPAANPDGAPFPLLVIGWTLNYEMAFYVVFALFIGCSRPKALTLVAATLGIVVALGLATAPPSLSLRFWSDPIILEFIFGIGLFVLFDRQDLTLSNHARTALALAALILLALHPAFPGPWRPLVWGIPALLLVAAALPGIGDTNAREASHRAAFAGDVSYAVYLVHLPIVLILQHLLRRLPPDGVIWLGVFPVLVIVGTIIAATLLHAAVERPILRVARKATAGIFART